jgi:hypothetical protein
MVPEDDLGVLSSTALALRDARFVTINHTAVADLAGELARDLLEPPVWDAALHFADGTPRTANYVLVLDALNFSFWGEPRWRVEYQGRLLDGYQALAAALTRAVAGGVPLLEADYLARIRQADLEFILRGEGRVPLFEQRLANLREVGNVLRDKHRGWFVRAVEAADRSAVELVRRVVADFPSFDDVARYRGDTVRFYKRAQILVADLYGAYEGRDWGRFEDLDELTAFADYKVPQILRQLGILEYAPALAARVDVGEELRPGSAEEVEIRAATIWGVEHLRRALAGRGRALRAFELDWYLWNLSQSRTAGQRPYHRTRTTFY